MITANKGQNFSDFSIGLQHHPFSAAHPTNEQGGSSRVQQRDTHTHVCLRHAGLQLYHRYRSPPGFPCSFSLLFYFFFLPIGSLPHQQAASRLWQPADGRNFFFSAAAFLISRQLRVCGSPPLAATLAQGRGSLRNLLIPLDLGEDFFFASCLPFLFPARCVLQRACFPA